MMGASASKSVPLSTVRSKLLRQGQAAADRARLRPVLSPTLCSALIRRQSSAGFCSAGEIAFLKNFLSRKSNFVSDGGGSKAWAAVDSEIFRSFCHVGNGF
jgi:hypothetical protein